MVPGRSGMARNYDDHVGRDVPLPPPPPAAAAALADILDRAIPPHAVVARRPGLEAVLWDTDGGHGADTFALFSADGAEARFASLRPHGLDLDTLLPILAGEAEPPRGFVSVRSLLWSDPEPFERAEPSAERREALLAIASTLDAPAWTALHWIGAKRDVLLDFLDARRHWSADAHALLRAEPWIAGAYHLDLIPPQDMGRALDEHGAEGFGTWLLAQSGLAPSEAGTVARRLRAMGSTLRPSHFQGLQLAGVAGIPDGLWPVGGLQDEVAALNLARVVDALARGTGRTHASVLGRRGWHDTLRSSFERVGMEGEHATLAEAASATAESLSFALLDMVDAFARQVVEPARLAMGADAIPAEGIQVASLEECAADPVHAAAMRLLLGDGTLSALAERCARWHARVNGIQAFVGALPGGPGAGPRLFDDLDVGDGLYLACLNTAAALRDEGAPGPDADGVPGLDHCVASYALEVLSGGTCIVSLRRRLPGGGFERVSTAEVEFVVRYGGQEIPGVVQHFGRGNAPVPREVADRLRKGLLEVEEDARIALLDFRQANPDPVGEATLIHAAGAWEAVRDMWAFALTRPRRAMGPADLLREGGLAAEPEPAPGPTP